MLKTIARKAKMSVQDFLLQPVTFYRLYLKMKYGIDSPSGYPKVPWENKVLKTHKEWISAVDQVESLDLPSHSDPPKDWDSLAALNCILTRTNPTGYILDAGAELYSMILPWLFLYGYKNLYGINLAFEKCRRRGPIHYRYGDITKTSFNDKTFDAVTCLSVVEHGVDLKLYFKEMSRILKPNGILITSTDYHEFPINTKDKKAYGVPVHIFSRNEISAALDIANDFDLELTNPIDLSCNEKPIYWKRLDLRFTYLIFSLQKKL